MEDSENQVLTAKAGEAPEAAPKKKSKRALWIVLAVLGACLIFGLGAVAGGGAVFGLSRARSRVLARPLVERWVSPRELPDMNLPVRPGRGMIGFGSGAMIVEVVPDGPADQAGLRQGDVVIVVEGQEIDDDNDLASVIDEYEPGDKVTIEVVEMGPRSGQGGREVTVILAEHPETKGKAYLGVTFVPMSPGGFGDEGGMFRFHEYGDDGPCDDCEEHDERFERHFEFRWPRR